MSDREIILIGGGGHCRSCIDVIENNPEFSIAGVIEQPGKGKMGSVLGYPVIGDDNELEAEAFRQKYRYACITIGLMGSPSIRKNMFEKLKKLGFIMPAIVSDLAHVSRHAMIGEGSVVMHHAVVNAGATIGTNCIINSKSLLEHDVIVKDHTHISTAAVVNGQACIGKGCFIGSNSTVVQGCKIPDGIFFKAGALITGPNDGYPVK